MLLAADTDKQPPLIWRHARREYRHRLESCSRLLFVGYLPPGTHIGVSPYSAGKGGGLAFTRTLALEVARSGVTANSLALGLMTRADEVVDQGIARSIPVGRVGTPDDVGAACVWLASDEASWVTGHTIEINGGSITT